MSGYERIDAIDKGTNVVLLDPAAFTRSSVRNH